MSIVLECSTKGVARFACARAGCAKCLQRLLGEHLGLVYWVVKHLEGGGQEKYADLIQEGRIGLWQAIEHYEERRGVCFSTYACVVIRHRAWQAVQRSLKAEGWLEAEEREADFDRVVRVWQQAQLQEALGEELAGLPTRLRELMERHYGFSGGVPQNLAEIGRAWGVTRERIRQLHEQALSLLRLPALSMRLRSLCEQSAERSGDSAFCGQPTDSVDHPDARPGGPG